MENTEYSKLVILWKETNAQVRFYYLLPAKDNKRAMAASAAMFRPKWLSSGVFKWAALSKLARNVDSWAPPSPLKSEFALNKIQKTCITLKSEEQWVSI